MNLAVLNRAGDLGSLYAISLAGLFRVNLTCKPYSRRSGEQQEARDQSVTLGRNQAINVLVRVGGMGTQVRHPAKRVA